MRNRKISASYLFTLTGEPLKNGIVEVDKEGVIRNIVDTRGNLIEEEGLEYYSGIICPGFVNAHCHLELSHLKDKIEKGIGLPGFLKQINLLRKVDDDFQLLCMRQADRIMQMNGIVAVGDISNGSLSLEVKETSKLWYHTFIECFGFLPERAPRAIEYAGFISYLYDAAKLPYSVTPHSAYSVSDELWQLVMEKAVEKGSILSVHHQESEEEDRMFSERSGGIIDHYANNLKMDTSFWQPGAANATDAILNKVPVDNDLLLVHNTFLDSEKLNVMKERRKVANTSLVTCPNSNLTICNTLPDYQLLAGSGFPVCIGTDSLASNRNLSVLEEIKVISEAVPAIQLGTLLEWSCLNGARALKIDNWAGSIDVGKRPGLNLISDIDLRGMKLTGQSRVKPLIL